MANRLRFAIVAGLLGLSACTVHQTNAPSAATVGGTTDFSLSLDMTAAPDIIPQDGSTTSSIEVIAHGPDGRPKAQVKVRLDMQVGGVTQDFGTLNARNVVTGSDGRAATTYTAPPTSPLAGGTGTVISIVATPIGTDAQAINTRSVSIRLVPPGVVLPPAGSPTAAFTFAPPSPTAVGVLVRFDATTSDPGAGASRITSYEWNFGDGASATGVAPTHTFDAVGTYNVTLAVTNDRGLRDSKSQAITVNASAPQVSFTVTPTDPNVGQNVLFVDASTAVAGRTNVKWDWNFGEPDSLVNTASGQSVQHAFSTKNTFKVVLTVTDDLGQKGTFSQNVVPK
jgi:PKD repeat protein